MQLKLPLGLDENTLLEYLKKSTGSEIRLTITNNASSMISVRKSRHTVFLRLHRIFLKAGTEVIDEISGFLRNTRQRTPLVRRYLLDHADDLPVRPRKRQELNPKGRCHDLAPLAASVNDEYFGGGISAHITWGSRRTGHSIRRRILGSYNGKTDIIRINTALDRKDVPQYYIRFIIYHEMLHADIGISKKNGRRQVHTREFRRRERLFKDYEKALFWEKKRL